MVRRKSTTPKPASGRNGRGWRGLQHRRGGARSGNAEESAAVKSARMSRAQAISAARSLSGHAARWYRREMSRPEFFVAIVSAVAAVASLVLPGAVYFGAPRWMVKLSMLLAGIGLIGSFVWLLGPLTKGGFLSAFAVWAVVSLTVSIEMFSLGKRKEAQRLMGEHDKALKEKESQYAGLLTQGNDNHNKATEESNKAIAVEHAAELAKLVEAHGKDIERMERVGKEQRERVVSETERLVLLREYERRIGAEASTLLQFEAYNDPSRQHFIGYARGASSDDSAFSVCFGIRLISRAEYAVQPSSIVGIAVDIITPWEHESAFPGGPTIPHGERSELALTGDPNNDMVSHVANVTIEGIASRAWRIPESQNEYWGALRVTCEVIVKGPWDTAKRFFVDNTIALPLMVRPKM